MTTLRLAHRGDWRVAPENSLAAMTAALAIPACDGLEFDVRASAEGVPVLLHDASLERVQGLLAACSSLTVPQLAAHGIPTLTEVLAATGYEPFLDIELKERVPGAIPVIAAARSPARTVLSSFQPAILDWLAGEGPDWPRWLNAASLDASTIELALAHGCLGVSVDWPAITPEGVDAARDRGLEVAAWTVREPADFDRLAGLGLAAVCVEAGALDG